MPKLLKKTKNYLPKTIKAYSLPLDSKTYIQLDNLFVDYGKCRGQFFNQLCGINNLENVTNFRQIRNQIRQLGINKTLVSQYDFLNKHWVYALFDTCSNINSMWSNTANKIRKVIQTNDNLTVDERHYLYYVLRFNTLWLGILKYNTKAYLALPKKYQESYMRFINDLTNKQLTHLHGYLRRLTRRYKAYPHKVSLHNKSMTYDENMYRFKSDNLFCFSSNKNRQVFNVTLTSNWRYSKKGNLQIILNRYQKRLEIHKLIKTHKCKLNGTKTIGIDKGLYTLISCSTDNEYGIGFSELANQEVDRLSKVNANRNKIRHYLKLKGQTLTNKQYLKKRNQHREYLHAVINSAIYQMILNEKPKEIIKEDLTFTTDKLPKIYNKQLARLRRNLSSWTKGYLDERLEYICDKYSIKYQNINPAYTSQYCPKCGHKFKERTGVHHELTYCINCGWMNANTAAAKNILKRKDDNEISLYTPYKNVKKILDSRI